MSNVITDWQVALIALLADATPDGLGIPFLDRERDGLSRERDLGCVFAPKPAWQQVDSNVLFANFFMTVRVWKRFKAEPAQDKPPDTIAIDQLAIDIPTLLEAVQTTLVPNFYFWVAQMTTDYADQGVEAKLVGWARNPATDGS